MPAGLFHLILCRNLVLTYFEDTIQLKIMLKIIEETTLKITGLLCYPVSQVDDQIVVFHLGQKMRTSLLQCW